VPHRQQLHLWAERYHDQRWPGGTPQYLLRGYYRMLYTTGDVSRMVEYATDPARHDRMLELTGADTAALAEITTVQDVILAQPEPDLLAMTRLAIRRDDLTERNAHMPTDLPAIWAVVGHLSRAEALARAITDPYKQARVLSNLVKIVARTGNLDGARALASAITDPDERAVALALVTAPEDDALTWSNADLDEPDEDELESYWGWVWDWRWDDAVGEDDRSETHAWSHADPYDEEQAWHWAFDRADTVEDGDHRDEAPAWSQDAPHPDNPPRASAVVWGEDTWSETAWFPDDPADAECAWQWALGRADTAEDGDHWDEALAWSHDAPGADDLAWASVEMCGGEDNRIEALAWSNADPDDLEQAWQCAVEQADRVGVDDDDTQWLDTETFSPLGELTMLAEEAVSAGYHDRAVALAELAATMVRAADLSSYEYWLTRLAVVLAMTGDYDRAIALAHAVTDAKQQARALTAVAEVAAGAGDHERAAALADQAAALARAITSPHSRAQTLSTMAKAVARAGDHERATRLANQAAALIHSRTDPDEDAQALTTHAAMAADATEHDPAGIIGSVSEPGRHAMRVTAMIADAGELDRAETVAHSIGGPGRRGEALATLARSAARAGYHQRATRLANQAAELTSSITDPDRQASVLIGLAEHVEPVRARQLIARTLRTSHWTRSLEALVHLQPAVVIAVADEYLNRVTEVSAS
jgi:tetratricopeptide (TPR) repeat protein